jgi:hypothetical protein
MKQFWFLFLFLSTFSFSQTKIFRGEYSYPNNLIYSITNQSVEKMNSSLWGKEVLFLKGRKVYDDSFRSNCVYTIEGNKIYRGDGTSVFDVLYEYDNGKFYQVSSGSLRRCLFTLSNNQIFIGDSTSTFDCVFAIELDTEVNNSVLLIFLSLAPY